MKKIYISCLQMLLLCTMYGHAFDDIELEVHSGGLLKILRDMAGQTKADTLNLPANATSIRENITDTFSCENRTYGYYADVDNDCQVFHVCLPSQTPGGRNVTYKWSFICPNETVFNQEVLVCTRPRDSIDCADSPMYYDLNLEIGKITNNTKDKSDPPKKVEKNPITNRNKNQNRTQDKRKQNIVVENLIKEIINEEMNEKLQDIDFSEKNDEEVIEIDMNENEPQAQEGKDEFSLIDDDVGRIALERSMRNERKLKRGSFRFKGDV